MHVIGQSEPRQGTWEKAYVNDAHHQDGKAATTRDNNKPCRVRRMSAGHRGEYRQNTDRMLYSVDRRSRQYTLFVRIPVLSPHLDRSGRALQNTQNNQKN